MAKRQYFDKQQNLSITTWMDRDHWFTTVFQLIPAASPVPSGRNSYDLVSRNSDNQKWETAPSIFFQSPISYIHDSKFLTSVETDLEELPDEQAFYPVG